MQQRNDKILRRTATSVAQRGMTLIEIMIVIIIMIVLSSMVADTMDEGELRTGKRQEGMYASAVSFIRRRTMAEISGGEYCLSPIFTYACPFGPAMTS